MKNELTFESSDQAAAVAKVLLQNQYVVMLSVEERLTVLNYEWTPNYADRNYVVFGSADDYEALDSEYFAKENQQKVADLKKMDAIMKDLLLDQTDNKDLYRTWDIEGIPATTAADKYDEYVDEYEDIKDLFFAILRDLVV